MPTQSDAAAADADAPTPTPTMLSDQGSRALLVQNFADASPTSITEAGQSYDALNGNISSSKGDGIDWGGAKRLPISYVLTYVLVRVEGPRWPSITYVRI